VFDVCSPASVVWPIRATAALSPAPPGDLSAAASQRASEELEALIKAVQDLPWGVHLIVLAAAVGGVVLWLFGRQVIRPTTAIVGAALGAAVGFVMLPALAPAAGVSPYLGLLAGLVIGLIAGAMLHRFTVAAVFSGVLAGGCSLLAVGLIHLSGDQGLPAAAVVAQGGTGLGGEEQPLRRPPSQPLPPDDRVLYPTEPPAPRPPAPPRDSAPARDRREPGTHAGPAARGPEPPSEQSASGTAQRAPTSRRAQTFKPGTAAYKAQQLYVTGRAALESQWEQTPRPHRMWIIGAGVIGAGVGVMAGVLMPGWAAAAVTSLVGAAIWIPAGVWLAHAFYLPGREALSLSPAAWAIIWLVIAGIGMAIQTQGLLPGSDSGGTGTRRRARRGDDD
jgi:hypothetical protein